MKQLMVVACFLVPACAKLPTGSVSDKPNAKEISDSKKSVEPKQIKGLVLKDGALEFKIVRVVSGGVSGLHFGQFDSNKLTYVQFQAKNTGAGKIIKWPSLQGEGRITDEHGNKFLPYNIRNWAWLPNNEPDEIRNGDNGMRINPGETYESAAYYEFVPPTSKRLTITIPINGRDVSFTWDEK